MLSPLSSMPYCPEPTSANSKQVLFTQDGRRRNKCARQLWFVADRVRKREERRRCKHVAHVARQRMRRASADRWSYKAFSAATPPICLSQRSQAACGTKGQLGEETLYYGQMMESAFCLRRQSTYCQWSIDWLGTRFIVCAFFLSCSPPPFVLTLGFLKLVLYSGSTLGR